LEVLGKTMKTWPG